MIKVVIFFRRKPGMAVAAFREHWRDRHAPLIVRLPGLRRYVQNDPVEDNPVFDAVAESSFDDTQAMKDLARTPAYAAVLADEPNFIDRTSMGSIITEERVLKDGRAPPGGVKLIALVGRDPRTPIDEFFRQWLENGKRFSSNGAVRRYVQYPCRRAIYDSGRTPAYDGAAMAWFDDLKALEANREPASAAARSTLIPASERVVSSP